VEPAVGGTWLGEGIPDVVVAGGLIGDPVRSPADGPGAGLVAVVVSWGGVVLVLGTGGLGVVGRLTMELPPEGVAVTGVGRTHR
jgi:hypothetical protein